MNRILIVLMMLCITSRLSLAQQPKYNVLFIISDDLRPEITCYGGMGKTLNIDALASAGVRFEHAYCQYPLCNPSRASMLTGRHPTTTGVIGNRTDFRATHPDWISLPQLFKENGYASLRSGKIFHGGIDDPKAWTAVAGPSRVGGDEGLTQAQRSDRWIILSDDAAAGENDVADRTIEYLRQHKDKPFFIGCGFSKPHSPLTAPKRFFDLYDLEKIPLPENYAPAPAVPDGFPRGAIRPRNADLFIGRDSTPQTAREMIRAYLASISWMDWNVGRVIAELDKLGLREKTIIVFWGDHGYQLGERGKWSKAGCVFEIGARVPLIMVVPDGKSKGKATSRIVQSIDIYPTLVELCGLPRPEGLEGNSLVPQLNDVNAEWDHPAFTSWSEDGQTLTAVSVRTERWRYAEFALGGPMLIDMQNDSRETRNLASDPQYAQQAAELSSMVKKYAK